MRRRLAPSREQARRLIETGAVLVSGTLADKPGRLVDEAEPVLVQRQTKAFASRGGEKLDAALQRFDISVAGSRCLDAGASTGGFTDCLLERGAAHVVAVDVGYGQLLPRLRDNNQVTVLERTNIRELPLDDVGGALFDVVVADLSFISLATVMPDLVALAAPGAAVVVLVKPQFEAGRQQTSRGRGVIRDPVVRREALERVASALVGAGATIMGAMASPLLGPAGNAEFLLYGRAPEQPVHSDSALSLPSAMLDAAVAEAPDSPDATATDAADNSDADE